jgi:hypothetical protein
VHGRLLNAGYAPNSGFALHNGKKKHQAWLQPADTLLPE